MQGLYTYYFFIGIGGIGMSALARFFKQKGAAVYGYDLTPTKLTRALESEGIEISYTDSVDAIPDTIKTNVHNTLVIYTPAVPEHHIGLSFFKANGFVCQKRAKVLGSICNLSQGIAIAGTHGKTSITTAVAHIMYNSQIGCSAFLGGISKNFETNIVCNPMSDFVVVEADEYDRSFHALYPHTALVSSMDADHLDIYHSHQEIIVSFYEFVTHIKENGIFIHKYGLAFDSLSNYLHEKNIRMFTYHLSDSSADFYAKDVVWKNAAYSFTLVTPFGELPQLTLRTLGIITLENCIAACAVALSNGVEPQEVADSVAVFSGVERRLDVQFAQGAKVYIDDYAHHPEELKAAIQSIKQVFPDKKITGIFQPHLFSRTQDFAQGFGESLSLLDELLLLDIYPAREVPIEGVTSTLIYDAVSNTEKCMCSKAEVLTILQEKEIEVLVTMGAGDIDTLIDPLVEFMKTR